MSEYIHDSVDNHPYNNVSRLPEESPPDGTELSVSPHEIAAQRTVQSVKSERTPGPITKSLVAAGLTPEILGRVTAHVASGAYNKFKNR